MVIDLQWRVAIYFANTGIFYTSILLDLIKPKAERR